MSLPTTDRTKLNNLSPNLVPQQIAVSALRLAVFQEIYTYLDNIITDLNAAQATGAVTTAKLADGSVSTLKLADNAVTGAKLLDAAVIASKLADGSVTTQKVGDGAVVTIKLADGAVVSAKIADLNVTSGKIADNAVISVKLADGAVLSAKIADGAVTAVKIADGTITGAKIADNTITTQKLVDSIITAAKILDGSVTNAKLAPGSVTGDKVANGAINSQHMDAALLASAASLSTQAEFDKRGNSVEKYANQVVNGDWTAAIQAALNSGFKNIIAPFNTYNVTGSITIPTGVSIDFMGSTVSVPKDNAFDVFTLTDGSKQKISNVKIIETGHAFTQRVSGAGIRIKGNSEQVVLENVNVEGCQSGIAITSDNGTQNTKITLRNCRADYSSQYGFMVDNSSVVMFDDCYAYHNWLDGFKLRKSAKNITILSGESSLNGESIVSAGNGNGVDTYAGGENFVINGLVCDGNRGAGIYIKTGDFNDQNGEIYGYIRNGQIIGVQCRNNTGSGLDLNRSGGDIAGTGATYPLVTHFQVIGGVFESNQGDGIYVRGRNIVLVAPTVKNNNQNGINIGNGFDVSIINPICTANSRQTVGGYYGINISVGKRIKVIGGTINGCDGDSVTTDDYSGLTVYHSRAINVQTACDEIIIKGVHWLNWANTLIPVRSTMTTGKLTIDYGNIGSQTAFGSEGSTMFYNNVPYIKTTDVSDIAGWQPIHKQATTQADSVAVDVATLKTDFNALLAKMKAAKLMA